MNFLRRLFKSDNDSKIIDDIIDLLDYHYNVESVYLDIIIINLDVVECDIKRGQLIKFLNKIYQVYDIEHDPSNIQFKYKLIITEV